MNKLEAARYPNPGAVEEFVDRKPHDAPADWCGQGCTIGIPGGDDAAPLATNSHPPPIL